MLMLQDLSGVFYTPYQLARGVSPDIQAEIVRYLYEALEGASECCVPQLCGVVVSRVDIKPVVEPLRSRLHAAIEGNPWLRTGGIDFEDGLMLEDDYVFHPLYFRELGALAAFFAHGNWGTRTAVVWADLMFVQQVNGGDEWATYKITDEVIAQFESVTMQAVMDAGDFVARMHDMRDATLEECRALKYRRSTD